MLQLFCLLVLMGLTGAYTSPVLQWGANATALPALTTVSQTQFADVMHNLSSEYMIVAFLETDLRDSDLLCRNESSKESCFAYLKKVTPKTYYSSVDAPAEVLQAMTNDLQQNSVASHGQLECPIACGHVGKIHMIKFNDSASDRAQTLKEHDAIIEAISRGLSCPIAYLYLSARQIGPSQIAHRRRKRRGADSNVKLWMTELFVLHYEKLTRKNARDDKQWSDDLEIARIEVSSANSQLSVTLSLLPSGTINFDVDIVGSYYSIKLFRSDEVNYHVSGIDIPTSLSYFCGDLVAKSINSTQRSSLIWSKVQFQVQDGKPTEVFKFKEPWHCVGFVTPAILSGLFVVALMASIASCGICWIFDINAVDRFDNPLGKTITIPITE